MCVTNSQRSAFTGNQYLWDWSDISEHKMMGTRSKPLCKVFQSQDIYDQEANTDKNIGEILVVVFSGTCTSNKQ